MSCSDTANDNIVTGLPKTSKFWGYFKGMINNNNLKSVITDRLTLIVYIVLDR